MRNVFIVFFLIVVVTANAGDNKIACAGNSVNVQYGKIQFTVPDSYTKLLLHCDGANGGTTFTDATGKTVTPQGDAKTITATKKFGTASMEITNDASYVWTADSEDWNLSTQDWTIDFWNNFIDKTVSGDWYAQDDSGVNYHLIYWSGTQIYPLAVKDTSTTEYQYIYNWSPNNGEWHHITLSRNGTNMNLFIDGTKVTWTTVSTPIGTTSLTNVAANVTLNTGVHGSMMNYMDEFRFSKGIARWTANFTPPTRSYNE